MAEVMLGRRVVRHSPAHLGTKKVAAVMHEYGEGALRSSSGERVTSREQAVAIAMSAAGMSRRKRTRR